MSQRWMRRFGVDRGSNGTFLHDSRLLFLLFSNRDKTQSKHFYKLELRDLMFDYVVKSFIPNLVFETRGRNLRQFSFSSLKTDDNTIHSCFLLISRQIQKNSNISAPCRQIFLFWITRKKSVCLLWHALFSVCPAAGFKRYLHLFLREPEVSPKNMYSSRVLWVCLCSLPSLLFPWNLHRKASWSNSEPPSKPPTSCFQHGDAKAVHLFCVILQNRQYS